MSGLLKKKFTRNMNIKTNTQLLSVTDKKHLNLALKLQRDGQYNQAEAIYRSFIAKNMLNETVFSQLALICAQTNRIDEAKILSLKTLEMFPDSVTSLLMMGDIYRVERNFTHAVEHYQAALRVSSNNAIAQYYLSICFAELGLLDKSIMSCKSAIKIDPKLTEAVFHLGQVLIQQNNLVDSKAIYQKLALKKEFTSRSQYMLGNICKYNGNLEDAKKHYLHALSSNPNFTQAHLTYANAHKYQSLQDPHFVQMLLQFNSNKSLPKESSINLSFALAKAYEDIKAYDNAFHYLQIGNKLRFDSFNYDINSDKKFIDNIIHHFNKEAIDKVRLTNSTSKKPIFIVGMPRSGTSLVEKIISTHTKVYGAGELEDFFRLGTTSFINKSNNFLFTDLINYPKSTFNDIAKQYLLKIEGLSKDHPYVTDKLPFNMLMIGLIKIIFPHATIIHCVRNAKDNCLAIFKQNFATDNYRFAYNLTTLGKFHNCYQKLMNHWHNLFPGEIYDIEYERLVSEPEIEIRKLINACSLNWQDNCLDFNKSKGIVKTASASQVRQPIHKNSVSLWKQYEPFIGTLLKEI